MAENVTQEYRHSESNDFFIERYNFEFETTEWEYE